MAKNIVGKDLGDYRLKRERLIREEEQKRADAKKAALKEELQLNISLENSLKAQ